MKKTFYFFFIIFSFITLNAKDTLLCSGNKAVNQLMDQGIAFKKEGKTKEAIEVFQKTIELTKSIGCEEGELAATKNIMLIYSNISDYKNALKISERVKELALNQKNYRILATLYDTRATLYDYMGLYNESLKEYEIALKYAKLIPDTDVSHYQLSFTYYNLTPYYQNRNDDKVLYYLEKSREEILKVRDDSEGVPLEKKMDMLISVNMNLGIYYRDSKNKRKDISRSEYYFMEALKYVDKAKGEIDPYTKISLYQALQEFYKLKKDYKRSIEYGEKMLVLEKSNSMPYDRRVGYMVLAKSYLAVGDSKMSQKYLDLYSKLNDSILSVEKEAVEVPVKKIISETKKNSEYTIKKIAFISLGVIVMMIIIMVIYRKRSNKILHHKYQKIIAKLNTEKEKSIEENSGEIENKKVKLPTNTPDESTKVLLHKLEKFENSEKFLKKEINTSWLANNLNTNPKYLSETINTYKGKNFTNYINGLRIDYIVRKLYNDPKYREYKISYLAEECGFASSQVFVIAFKKINEVTPSYFINKVKQDAQ